MFRRFRTDAFNWILIIGVILLIAEIIFSFGSTIIPTLLFIVLLFIGWKNFHKLWGKILFCFFPLHSYFCPKYLGCTFLYCCRPCSICV